MAEVAGALLSLALLAVFAIGAIAVLLPRIRASLPRPRFSSTFVFCAAASTVLIVIGSSKTNSPPDRLMRGIASRLAPPLSTNAFPFGFAVWPFDHITAGVVSNMEATGELAIPDTMLATGLALSRVDLAEGSTTPPLLPSNSVEVAGWRLFNADNRCVSASLPFAFPLGDAEYDSVDILSNGRLSFGDTMLHRRPEGGVPAATNLFNHATVIAPAWGDTVLATWNDAAVLVATNSNAATIAWRNAFNPAAPSATNSLVECTLGRDGAVSWRYRLGDASFFTDIAAGVVAGTNASWSLTDGAPPPWLADSTNITFETTLARVGGKGWSSADDDGDGLTNYEEFLLGTSPGNHDTDGDGPGDCWEVCRCLSPFEADLPPEMPDTDGDGVPDAWEGRMGTNPDMSTADWPCADPDDDGFTTQYETDWLDSNPNAPSSPTLPDPDCESIAVVSCCVTSSLPCWIVLSYGDDASGDEEIRLAWIPGISPETVNILVEAARPASVYLEREETSGYWRCSLGIYCSGTAALNAEKTCSSDEGWFAGVSAPMRSTGGGQRGEEWDIELWRLDVPYRDIDFCGRLAYAEIALGELACYTGTVSWSSVPEGISGTGNPLVFNPSLLMPGKYLVTVSVQTSAGTYSKTVAINIRALHSSVRCMICDSRDTTTNSLPIDASSSFIPEGEDYYVSSDPPGIDSVEFVPAELTPGVRYVVDIWNGDCGYITVTVVTAHVDFELEATDPPGPRSDIGVGEVVICTASPAGMNISWSCTPGLADLSNESGPTATVSARDIAGNLNISANVDGLSFSTNYLVHEPSIYYSCPYMPNARLYRGEAGVGSRIKIYLAPTNVAFCNLWWKELTCPSTNATGWFAENPSRQIAHGIEQGALTEINAESDEIGWHLTDNVFTGLLRPTWTAGSLEWDIPACWWIPRENTSINYHRFIGIPPMRFEIEADGRATFRKFGSWGIRQTNGWDYYYDSNGVQQ